MERKKRYRVIEGVDIRGWGGMRKIEGRPRGEGFGAGEGNRHFYSIFHIFSCLRHLNVACVMCVLHLGSGMKRRITALVI